MLRLRTTVELLRHFVDSRRWFLLPLLLLPMLTVVHSVLAGSS